jgi:hypothetical protein
LISTTGVQPSDFTAIRTETLDPADYTEILDGMLDGYGMKQVRISLLPYLGETIHVAFRHWDCTDQDLLLLSHITIFADEDTTTTSIDVFNTENPLNVWIENDHLHIGGLVIGERLDIFTVDGKLVYQAVVTSEIMSVRLPARGVYIVRSGRRVLRVVY